MRFARQWGVKGEDIPVEERIAQPAPAYPHIRKALLHEVAVGSLDANLDEVGCRSDCARWGYRFFQGSLESIDRIKRTIRLASVQDDNGKAVIGRVNRIVRPRSKLH